MLPLGYTEKSDFSIFLKYPDIDFDPEVEKMDGPGPTIHASSSPSHVIEDGPGPAIHFSSPLSHPHDDGTDSASRSNSTPHTTPTRLEDFPEEDAPSTEYDEYLKKLNQADLPPQTIDYFHSLASQILQIARYLQPRTLYLSNTTTTDILTASTPLLSQLDHSLQTIRNQLSSIAHILSLAPFAMTPTDLALYSIYKQRSSLIIAHLSLPSRTEHNLLDALLPLFDAYIYSPYLHLPRHHFSTTCSDQTNALYNTLSSLIHAYSTWIEHMQHIKDHYMTPLIRRIQDSSWVKREMEQMEDALSLCAEMNAGSINDIISHELGEEQVTGAEILAQRRAKSSMALKERRRNMIRGKMDGMRTRVRREHTL